MIPAILLNPATLALANGALDLLIMLFASLSGPKAEDLRKALISAKIELDEVGKDVAAYKVTY